MRIDLNSQPDTYGFIYGTITDGDRMWSVNILPPKLEWYGDVKLDGYMPDDDWQVFVDGEAVSRVRNFEEAQVEALSWCEKSCHA